MTDRCYSEAQICFLALAGRRETLKAHVFHYLSPMGAGKKPVAPCESKVPEAGEKSADGEHGVGDYIELLLDAYGCHKGQCLQVIGENPSCLKLEGGKVAPRGHENACWKWACVEGDDDDAPDFGEHGSFEIESIAQRFHSGIQEQVYQDLEVRTGVRPSEDDRWRLVEDVIMKALLHHWGDGSFSPRQDGKVGAQKDLENNLKCALAAELKKIRRNTKLTKAEVHALISAWAAGLAENVHEGKPSVNLGEVTMYFQGLAKVF